MRSASIVPKVAPNTTDYASEIIAAEKFAAEVLGTNDVAIWSITGVTGEKVNEVATKLSGLKLVYSLHNGRRPVEVSLPASPTWRDLLKAANYLIRRSGDGHHVFVEDFRLRTDYTLELITGS